MDVTRLVTAGIAIVGLAVAVGFVRSSDDDEAAAGDPPDGVAPASRDEPSASPTDPAPTTAARGALADAPLDEAGLLRVARESLEADPSRTLALIDEADARFGTQDEPRRHLEIQALVRLGRIGESHAKAHRFYLAFPKSSAVAHIARLTGYHPRPWGPSR